MQQIESNSVVSLDNMFAVLVEQQTKKLMLANSKKGYVYKVLDAPYEPKMRISPRRTLIVIGLSIVGGLISFIYVFVTYFLGYRFRIKLIPPGIRIVRIS